MLYTLSNNPLTVQISSSGAELQSIRREGAEYLWQGDPQFWSGRSPVLFPYVGRLSEGAYHYGGKSYAMEIHGFARRMEFQPVEQSGEHIVLQIADTEETRKIYPFPFQLRISYTLADSTLRVAYRVDNTGDSPLHFGIGAHPGFRVPLEEGLSFSDYFLEFDRSHTPTQVGLTEDCFLSGHDRPMELEDGKILRLRHDLFDNDAIVLKDMAREITLAAGPGRRGVTVRYPQMPYLGLWHAPRTKAPYVCMEPWASLPSRQDITEHLEHKSDLLQLRPSETYTNDWEMRFF